MGGSIEMVWTCASHAKISTQIRRSNMIIVNKDSEY